MRRVALAFLLAIGGCTEANGQYVDDGGGDDQSMTDGGAPDLICAGPEICGDNLDNDCNGMTDEGCNGLGTWVSGATGVDTNPGTQAMPLKTIAKGMANAVTLGGARGVYVAGSHYPEKITLVEGVSLLGGYDCNATSCTWARDPMANDTAILNQDSEGVLAGKTITRATTVDGFRIQGQTGVPATAPGTACITIAGGSPTVTNNRINGGDQMGGGLAAARRSIGIAVLAPTMDPAGALIDQNAIQGGAAADLTTGILIDATTFPVASPAVAVITNNTIHGGTGHNSNGITAWQAGAATLVSGNTILAGSSPPAPGGTPGGAWGISVGSKMTIDKNRINTDQANVGTCSTGNTGFWCGGIVSYSSTTTITNNVVFGVKGSQSAGVFLTEAEVPAGAVVVDSNYLDGAGAGVGVAPTISAGLAIRIGGCGTCGVNAVFGDVRDNIMLGGVNLQRYGVYEDTVAAKTARPQSFDHNDLFFSAAAGTTDVLYSSWNGTTRTNVTMITAVNMLTAPPSTLNLSADPLVDATFHLGGSSPCIDTGTATQMPPKDFDGEARPKGATADIGPDEAK